MYGSFDEGRRRRCGGDDGTYIFDYSEKKSQYPEGRLVQFPFFHFFFFADNDDATHIKMHEKEIYIHRYYYF